MGATTSPPPGGAGRDRTGRFAPGNRAGRGNPFAKRIAELHTALLDAVEPRMVEAIAKRMVKSALEGDIAAAKIVLDRTLGRSAPVRFKLPKVRSVADLPGAINQILAAASRGEIGSEEAARFANVVEVAGRALQAAEVEERLARLESGAGIGPRKLA